MSRISDRFATLRERGEGGLIAFIAAGDPDLATTRALVLELERSGADVVELGVPFTDPLADGPSNQAAYDRGLRAGATLPAILDLVKDLRRETQLPLLLMTYVNPILHYGYERATKAAAAAGLDAFLMVDLPPEEAGDWCAASHANGLDTVFMLAPTSTDERIQIVARLARGFIYCVSRTGVTGARADLPSDLPALLSRVRRDAQQPIAVGFGISRPEQVREVLQRAEGVIVGSALVDRIARHGRDCLPVVGSFVRALKAATTVPGARLPVPGTDERPDGPGTGHREPGTASAAS
jgi:tryptophan synthase alpha chain